MSQKLYLYVSDDEYELPLAVAESAAALARMVGVTANAVRCGISRERHARHRSRYKCVEVGMTHEEAARKKEAFQKNVKCYSKEIGGIGELEKRIGVSPGYISRLGTGKRGLGIVNVLMICDVLGKTFEELCDENSARMAELKNINDEIERLVARRKELGG